MASYVPIIISNVSRMKELCNNEECLLFEADNSIDLSKKINLILKNEELKKKLIKNTYYYKSNKYTYVSRCKKIIEEFLDKE